MKAAMTAVLSRRRLLGGLALASSLWLAACASAPPAADPQLRATLAPTGALRVAVYPGSPGSLVRKPGAAPVGVAYELGRTGPIYARPLSAGCGPCGGRGAA